MPKSGLHFSDYIMPNFLESIPGGEILLIIAITPGLLLPP